MKELVQDTPLVENNDDRIQHLAVPVYERIAQALLCMLVIGQYIEHLEFIPITITQLFGFALVAICVANGRILMRPDPVFWFLGLFIFAFTVSTLIYLYEVPAVLQEIAIGKILSLVQYLGLYYFGYCLFKRQQTRNLFLISLFLGAVAVSILSCVGIGRTEKHVGRTSFEYMDENAMAALTGLGIVVSCWLGLYGANKYHKLTGWCGLLFMVSFLVGTGSRGGMLATGVGLIVLFMRKKIVYFIIGMGIVTIFTEYVNQSEMASERWRRTLETADISSRDEIYYEAWEQIKERPVLGRGDINGYLDLGARLNCSEKGYHNDMLWVLGSSGIIGAFFILFALSRLFNAIWRIRSSLEPHIATSLFATMCIVSLSVEFHNRKVSWLVLALVACGERISKENVSRHCLR